MCIFPRTALLGALSIAAFVFTSVRAEDTMRLAHVFQDHMVLQREKPAPVWGWAPPGTSVNASFAGQEKSATADDTGYWRVTFDPLPASATGAKLSVRAGNTVVTLNDVVVGEVWICAGQSNMARTLKSDAIDYPFFKDYANDADYPGIRFINFAAEAALTPQNDFQSRAQAGDKWEVLSKSTAMDCMSVPLFFAKELYKELQVPIGLLQVAVPGTPQTAWMSKETLDEVAADFPGSPSFAKAFDASEAKAAKANRGLKSWAEFEAANRLSNESTTGRPLMMDSTVISIFTDYPTVLYNALIHPLAPMAVRGVIWHQGESGPGPNYKERLIAKLDQWRKLFGQDLAYIFGSIARKATEPPPLVADSLAVSNINEELLLAAQATHGDDVAFVNFCDLGNHNLHWAEREDAGQRMAGAALKTVYGRSDRVYSGPELIEAKVEGDVIKARFRNIGGGLVYEPSIGGISGFVLEGKGGSPSFQWASSVTIDGDTVTISNPAVKNPVNVYYGWAANPHETLFNKEGFPAFPFRMVARQPNRKAPDAPPMVQLLTPKDDASLNVLHVRRNGFLFSVVKSRGPLAPATVRVQIPSEWKTARILIGDKPFPDQPVMDASGVRSYELPVEVNGAKILVGDAENFPDFSTVDRF